MDSDEETSFDLGTFHAVLAAAGSSSTRDMGRGGIRRTLDSAPEDPWREKPVADTDKQRGDSKSSDPFDATLPPC